MDLTHKEVKVLVAMMDSIERHLKACNEVAVGADLAHQGFLRGHMAKYTAQVNVLCKILAETRHAGVNYG